MKDEFIYNKCYIVKDLKENAYISYFDWRGNNYTNLIHRAKRFETEVEALGKSRYAEIEFIEIIEIYVDSDIDIQ